MKPPIKRGQVHLGVLITATVLFQEGDDPVAALLRKLQDLPNQAGPVVKIDLNIQAASGKEL